MHSPHRNNSGSIDAMAPTDSKIEEGSESKTAGLKKPKKKKVIGKVVEKHAPYKHENPLDVFKKLDQLNKEIVDNVRETASNGHELTFCHRTDALARNGGIWRIGYDKATELPNDIFFQLHAPPVQPGKNPPDVELDGNLGCGLDDDEELNIELYEGSIYTIVEVKCDVHVNSPMFTSFFTDNKRHEATVNRDIRPDSDDDTDKDDDDDDDAEGDD